MSRPPPATGGNMKRRVFVIEAGQAFPAVAGALYLIGCGSSTTSPSAVADLVAFSTNVNSHTHSASVPAADQLHPATSTYTSSPDSVPNPLVTLSASQLSTLASGGSVTVT